MLSILKISKDKDYYRANLVTASKDEEFQTTDVSFYEKHMRDLLLEIEEKEERFLPDALFIGRATNHFKEFVDSGRNITMMLQHEGDKRLVGVSVDDFGSLWFDVREEADGQVVKMKPDLASRPLLEAFDLY